MLEAQTIQVLRNLLEREQAEFTIIQHDAHVHTAIEGVNSGFGSLESMAPTLILNTEKGCLAAIISGTTRMVYKLIKKELGLKNISLASKEQIKELTSAEVGCVPLINLEIETIIDEHLLKLKTVYGGTGLPGHTLQIKPDDLVRINNARVFSFAQNKKCI